MTLFSSEKILEDIINSKSTLREIQTEHMIYQLNSSSDTKKTTDILRRDVEAISKAIENARRIAFERKLTSDELKINLAEKKDKMKQLERELDRIRAQVTSAAKKTLAFESEKNKMKIAIEKIKEASQDLDAKYIEQYQNELMNALVKLTSETAKAHSDLDTAKERESIALKKLQDMERDYNESESHTISKTNEADRIISNVSMTIEHIVKSYEEIATVSKDLLKSSTAITRTEYEEEFNQGIEQNIPNQGIEQNIPNQGIEDSRIAI